MAKRLRKKTSASSRKIGTRPVTTHKGVSGLIIAGFLLGGLGTGILYGQGGAGLFIGLGIGLLLAAVLRAKYSW